MTKKTFEEMFPDPVFQKAVDEECAKAAKEAERVEERARALWGAYGSSVAWDDVQSPDVVERWRNLARWTLRNLG